MNYLELINKDFQDRKGNYPESDVPTDIMEATDGLVFAFKNTTRESAEGWTANYLDSKGLNPIKIHSYQAGDYRDDWVEVIAYLKGVK